MQYEKDWEGINELISHKRSYKAMSHVKHSHNNITAEQ